MKEVKLFIYICTSALVDQTVKSILVVTESTVEQIAHVITEILVKMEIAFWRELVLSKDLESPVDMKVTIKCDNTDEKDTCLLTIDPADYEHGKAIIDECRLRVDLARIIYALIFDSLLDVNS